MGAVGCDAVVTGGAGFLGSRVVQRLRERGLGRIVVPRSHEVDLRDAGAVARLFDAARPGLLIHLAAVVGGIGLNRAQPGRLFHDNALMGLHVLEAARRVGVRRFVSVATVCSYPAGAPLPLHESDLWNGHPEETNAAYGLAKRMLLAQGQAYRQQYGFPFIGLLPTNLYGPGDDFDLETGHVLPAIVRRCVEACETGRGEIVLWGDGTPTREFLYVDDAAEAIVLAAERYDGEEPVNVGSGEEVSIRELAARVAAEVGFTGRIAWDPSFPNGAQRRCVDSGRAKALLGFEARTPLREGIARTVAWYRQWAAGSAARRPAP
jgi:GDP-L-fucose synthase